MLDLDGGAPWALLCSLMQAAPRKRLSAAAAAAHPALGGGLTGALNSALWRLGDAADKVGPLTRSPCLVGACPLSVYGNTVYAAVCVCVMRRSEVSWAWSTLPPSVCGKLHMIASMGSAAIICGHL